MKTLRIDGQQLVVFVLLENDTRCVYIPVNALHRVDYEQLVEFSANCPSGISLLQHLSESSMKNGRNALVQCKNIIQVMVNDGKNSGQRVKKPNEPRRIDDTAAAAVGGNGGVDELVRVLTALLANQQPAQTTQPVINTQQTIQPVFKEQQHSTVHRRKPGPKPKNREVIPTSAPDDTGE